MSVSFSQRLHGLYHHMVVSGFPEGETGSFEAPESLTSGIHALSLLPNCVGQPGFKGGGTEPPVLTEGEAVSLTLKKVCRSGKCNSLGTVTALLAGLWMGSPSKTWRRLAASVGLARWERPESPAVL